MHDSHNKLYTLYNTFLANVLLCLPPGSAAFIGASLSEPHHMGSTVKSVFLLVFLLACLIRLQSLYMAESRLSANQHYIKHYKHYIKHVEC